MDLTLTDEQQMLQQTVRELCAKRATSADVRRLENDRKGYDEALWRELAELDLLGLLIPSGHGGADATALEIAVVCEELGYAICPSPYIETAVFAASLLGDRGDWLSRIASGDAVLTVAWHEAGRSDDPDAITASVTSDGLSGEKILVPFASSADAFLTLARDDEGFGVYLVPRDGVELEQMQALASDNRYLARFDGVRGERIGGWEAFCDAMTDAVIAVAAYAIGGAQRAHEMSVEYANERVQFDRPIGSFQAINHPLAEMATEIAGGRTLLRQAAWARATRRSSAAALAAMAKLYGCDVFRRSAKLGHQVFGGIGFTLDIDIQLYMRRAKQLEVLWWGPGYLEQVVASAELDGEEPFVSPDPVPSAAAD